MALTVLAHSGCIDGSCPTFSVDDATGEVWVRGYDTDDPTREVDVKIPGQVWASLIAQLPR